MDRGAWQAPAHGVTKSQTWLSDFHFQWVHTNIHSTQQCSSCPLAKVLTLLRLLSKRASSYGTFMFWILVWKMVLALLPIISSWGRAPSALSACCLPLRDAACRMWGWGPVWRWPSAANFAHCDAVMCCLFLAQVWWLYRNTHQRTQQPELNHMPRWVA